MLKERITLDMDKSALYAARFAADAAKLSLAEWLSRVAWDQAIAESARHSAEQDRLHPDEPPGWAADSLERIFGEDPA